MNKEKRIMSIFFLIFSGIFWKNQGREITLKQLIFIICIACTIFALLLKIYLVSLSLSLIFLFTILFLFFIPGNVILNIFKFNVPLLDKSVLSISTGIVSVSVTYFFLALFVNQTFLTVFLWIWSFGFLVFFFLYYNPFKNSLKRIKFDIYSGVLVLLLLLIISAVVLLDFPNGMMKIDGLHFWGPHAKDSLWHLGLIGELLRQIPPQIPIYSGKPLVGYHYFYDLFIAIIYKFSKIELTDIFFRLGPTFLASTLALTAYSCFRQLSRKSGIALLGVFLIFFGGGLGFIPGLKNIIWFYSLTTKNLHFNYQTGMYLVMFLSGLYCISNFRENKKKSLIFLTGLFWGLSIEYKAFGFIILSAALLFSGIVEYLYKKDSVYLKVFIISLLCASPFIIQNLQHTDAGWFALRPSQFVIGVVGRLDLVENMPALKGLLLNKNPLISALLILGSIILFLVGSLGVRIIAIPFIFSLVKNKKSFTNIDIFLIFYLAFGFVFSILSSLTGKGSWNTMFFYLLTIYIWNFFAAGALFKMIDGRRIFLKTVITFLFIFFSLPATVQYIYKNILLIQDHSKSRLHLIVNKKDIEVINYLKSANTYRTVLVPRETSSGSDFLHIPSLSLSRGVITWPSMPLTLRIPKEEVEVRLGDVETFYTTGDSNKARSVLEKYRVDYVYCPSIEAIKFEKEQVLMEVFRSENVMLYKVKDSQK